jgi:phosphosulfolactate synthase
LRGWQSDSEAGKVIYSGRRLPAMIGFFLPLFECRAGGSQTIGGASVNEQATKENREQELAFSFIRVPTRYVKPRENGITVIADKGLGIRELKDILDLVGMYVDWFKIGFSAARIYSRSHLREKIRICHDQGVRVFFAGDFSELAYVQGVTDQYYREVKELGADGVEVASAEVYLPLDEKCLLVERAASCGLKVFGEVGQKGFDSWDASPNTVFQQIDRLRGAGAYKIVVQGEGVFENVAQINETQLFEIAAYANLEHLIFQGKTKEAQIWLVRNFGLEVNMDVESNQIIHAELCRRGLRQRGLFGLVASYKEQKL